MLIMINCNLQSKGSTNLLQYCLCHLITDEKVVLMINLIYNDRVTSGD